MRISLGVAGREFTSLPPAQAVGPKKDKTEHQPGFSKQNVTGRRKNSGNAEHQRNWEMLDAKIEGIAQHAKNRISQEANHDRGQGCYDPYESLQSEGHLLAVKFFPGLHIL